jgi:hypothetical protein
MDSDYLRWGRRDSFRPSWNERTATLAGLIPEDTNTLIEFGCGVGFLQECLPETIKYTGSDMVGRTPDTLVMDINLQPYYHHHDHYDVAFLSGVMEYVSHKKVPAFIDYLNEISDVVIVSYSDMAYDKTVSKKEGWANWYNQNQMIRLFTGRGFELDERLVWKTQKLYKFNKVKTTLRQTITRIITP